jgi:bifunctional DNA-binding transcriptional regulator/antitoxin component of YhaV-PrlF toxin-antitoxin module
LLNHLRSHILLYTLGGVQSIVGYIFNFPTRAELKVMPQVKLREKGQLTIPAELLQEWSRLHNVVTNDSIEVNLSNGVLMLVPTKRHAARRDIMSFAGVGKGLWGDTQEDIEASIHALRNSWAR